MGLMDRIAADMVSAMRAKDQARLAPLRMVKAAVMNREVEKGRALEDAEVQQVIASLIKQRRDSVEQFQKGSRPDLVERESAEITVLEAYVPPPLNHQQVEAMVDDVIREMDASSKDIGKVMKTVMAKLAGQPVDGKVVSDIVRARLSAS